MSRRRPSTREPITRDVLVRRTGLTFVIGSALFALGVLLQLPPHWPAIIGGLSYAVGAVFFTTAGFMQIALAVRDLSIDKRAGCRAAAGPGTWWPPWCSPSGPSCST